MRVRSGFSLLELTIVVAIVGVISAIGVPRYFESVRRTQVEGAARRLAADIDRLRDRAREQGRAQRIVLGDAGYVLLSTDDEGNDTKQGVDLTQEPYGVGLRAQVITDRGIEFDSLGRAGTPLVVYVSKGDTVRGVAFDPMSGRSMVFTPGKVVDGRVHADAADLPVLVRTALPVGVRTTPLQRESATPLATELNDVLR